MKVYYIFDDKLRRYWNVEQKQWRLFVEDGTAFVTKQGALKELESFEDIEIAIVLEGIKK